MFGVGWIFGILGGVTNIQAISVPFQVLFIIIAGFHGVLVFVFYPFRSNDARDEWKKWLYYVTCRKAKYHRMIAHSGKKFTVKASEENSSNQVRSDRTLSTGISSMAMRFGYRRGSNDNSLPLTSTSIKKSTFESSTPIADESSLDCIDEELTSNSDQASSQVTEKVATPDIYVFNKDDELLAIGNKAALSDWNSDFKGDYNLQITQSPSSLLLHRIQNDSSPGHDLVPQHTQSDDYTIFYNFEDDYM